MNEERLRRWRLLLGPEASELGEPKGADQMVENTLAALYDSPRQGGLGPSSPNVTRWLGDIRSYFPSSVVSVMQRDAIDRLGLKKLLMEPETLRAIQPDPHLAATLISLSHVLPPNAREAAREIVRSVVSQIAARIEFPTQQRLGRRKVASERRKGGSGTLDFDRTIRSNLRNVQPTGGMIIETPYVWPRGSRSLKHVVLAMDQSGSMATSLIYGGVYGSVLASLPALDVKAFAFSTDIVDLSDHLSDPVEMLFAARLGGGTDIAQALDYADQVIEFPTDTVLILLTDLFEGGSEDRLFERANHLVKRGVQMVCLLALSDDGEPAYDHTVAQEFANLGIPSFACTPDAFPDLLAEAIR